MASVAREKALTEPVEGVCIENRVKERNVDVSLSIYKKELSIISSEGEGRDIISKHHPNVVYLVSDGDFHGSLLNYFEPVYVSPRSSLF